MDARSSKIPESHVHPTVEQVGPRDGAAAWPGDACRDTDETRNIHGSVHTGPGIARRWPTVGVWDPVRDSSRGGNP
jgi:hypothetical protein